MTENKNVLTMSQDNHVVLRARLLMSIGTANLAEENSFYLINLSRATHILKPFEHTNFLKKNLSSLGGHKNNHFFFATQTYIQNVKYS